MPSEQRAYDKYNALAIPRPDGLLDGEPVLQAPAPDSMGVAFAVTALSNGFVELADNAEMKDPVRFMADGRTVYDAGMSALSYVNTILTAGQGYEDENLALTALYDFCAAARAYNP